MANFGTITERITKIENTSCRREIMKGFIATRGEVKRCFGYGEIRNCPLSLWDLYQKQVVSMS